jgi:hypothetical protein
MSGRLVTDVRKFEADVCCNVVVLARCLLISKDVHEAEHGSRGRVCYHRGEQMSMQAGEGVEVRSTEPEE